MKRSVRAGLRLAWVAAVLFVCGAGLSASAVREVRVSRDTELIDASASPRKPMLSTASRSSTPGRSPAARSPVNRAAAAPSLESLSITRLAAIERASEGGSEASTLSASSRTRRSSSRRRTICSSGSSASTEARSGVLPACQRWNAAPLRSFAQSCEKPAVGSVGCTSRLASNIAAACR